jgi:hypothetical protein
MLRRRLRTAAVGFLAVICVATFAFWVRSYKFRDEVNLRYWPDRVVELISMRGRLQLRNGSPFGSWPSRLSSISIEEWQSSSTYRTGFDAGSTGIPFSVSVPHWAVAVLAFCGAAILGLLNYRTSLSKARDGSEHLRLRFSLRMMLAVVFGFALLLWVGVAAFNFTTEEPTIPLSDEVARFNVREISMSEGVAEPPLTVDEVIASIQSQLSSLNSNPSIKTVFEKIQKTGRLPIGSRIDVIESAALRNGPARQAWWINLSVPVSRGRGYALRIRETGFPVFGQPSP